MGKIIIGIHGLKNKPPKRVLQRWWKRSIREGLKLIGHPKRLFRFKLVYWANFFYPKPMNVRIRDEKDPLFVDDPYLPSAKIERKKNSKLRQKLLNYLEQQLDGIFFNSDMSINFSGITDLIIHRFFRDLDWYYSKSCLDKNKQERQAKEVLREELARVLQQHEHDDIMLVSHSMGSIIAYDVLTEVVPHIKIHTFVTMGSPLGVPFIMSKNYQEQKKMLNKKIERSTTPENVMKHWFNFSDLEDKVAMNYNLGDDYGENSHHVQAVDHIVYTDYVTNGERRPHKSYGYLRTPEFARVVKDFLDEGKPSWWISLQESVNRFFTITGRKAAREMEQ